MIHDVTPIEHPSHHPPLIVRLHHRLMRNTAEFGRSLIFPSETSRASTLAELKKYQPAAPPSRVELLPVPDEFLGDISSDPDLAGANYFVVCGALDPHKNHAFLLHVWRKVIDSLGARSPKLVIAGSIQLSSGTVLRMLEQDAGLRRHVVLAPGLATPSLRSLILSAKALIMPSISEGFGLPIVEALAQGTAVIASDIPAHREAGRGGDVTYLSLGEAGIWAETIRDFSADGRRSNGDYRPKTWTDYFVGIEAFLNQLPALTNAPAEEDIALATKATS